MDIDTIDNYIAVVDLQGDLAFRTPRYVEYRCGILICSREFDKGIVSFYPPRFSRTGELRWWVMDIAAFDTLINKNFMNEMDQFFSRIVRDANLLTEFAALSVRTKREISKFKEWFHAGEYDYKLALANFCFNCEAITARGIPSTIPSDEILAGYRTVSLKYGNHVLARHIREGTTAERVFISISPLHYADLKHAPDIKLSVWREAYINLQVADLENERIAFQFCVYNPAIICAANQSMFTGHVRDLYLRNAEISRGMADGSMPASARDRMISDLGMVIIGQLRENVAPSFSRASLAQAKIMIFDWLYALLVLSSVVGALHCGITIASIRQLFGRRHPIVIRGRQFQFWNKTDVIGILMDFSACVIDPYVPHMRSATSYNSDILAQDQTRDLLSLLKQAGFADFTTRAEKILSEDFANGLRILSLLNPIMLLRVIFAQTEESGVRDFVQRLQEKCESEMRKLLGEGKVIEMWPLEEIIIGNFESKGEPAGEYYSPHAHSKPFDQAYTRKIRAEFARYLA